MPTIQLVAVLLLVLGVVWYRRLAPAIQQRRLTRELLALLHRVDTVSSDAAEQSVAAASLNVSRLLRPNVWLRESIAAARAVMKTIEAAGRIDPDDADLTAILDTEQQLLARDRAAFNPGLALVIYLHWDSRRLGSRRLRDDEFKELIPQILYYERGAGADSRRWCKYCLVAFEDQWPIAVSGRH